MIGNYFKIGWRNLRKNKTFTFLNIIGLSVAFGVAILLSMVAFFELSYDQFHKNIDNIYQVYSVQQTPEGAEAGTSRPVPYAAALKAEVPGIIHISRFLEDKGFIMHGDKEFNTNMAYLDNDFFSMFSFKVIKGNKEKPLKNKSSVVITEKAAKKLFGSEDPIGKTVTMLLNGIGHPFQVSAVLKNFPDQSSLDFGMAVNFENSPDYAVNVDKWDSSNHDVYLQLREGISASEFEERSHDFTELHYKEDIEEAKSYGAQPAENGYYRSLRLLPFEDINFTSIKNKMLTVSRVPQYLILGIALLILFIASVNFINMGIAKSTQRLGEIGMRKTLGAAKSQLFFQFWTESIIVFLSAFILGIFLSNVLLDEFKTLFHTEASFHILINPFLLVGLIITFLITTFIAGGYPALLLSKLETVQALKGKLEISGRNPLRNVLMAVQFGIAILLISGTLVIWSQLQYMRSKDLGFNKEQVIAFPINGQNDNFMQLFRNELDDNPKILSITAARDILGLGKDGFSSSSTMGFDYKGHPVETNVLLVDYDYVETLGLELLSGRSFSRKFATDSLSVLINEAMVKELKEENPLNARILGDTPYSVIGVLKNYNFEDLNKRIEPITILLNKNSDQLKYAYVKVTPQNLAQSFELVKTAWEKTEPNVAFMGSFLDENVERTFQREKNLTTIITGGSILAIVLSCLGLFAISLLIVAQRTKEIGIRKIVGASVSSITFLLVIDFLKLVGLAFIIAAPVAYWLLSNWLKDYPYRIELNIWFFVMAGILTVFIALVTMSVKTIKAALQNPVKSLRTE